MTRYQGSQFNIYALPDPDGVTWQPQPGVDPINISLHQMGAIRRLHDKIGSSAWWDGFVGGFLIGIVVGIAVAILLQGLTP